MTDLTSDLSDCRETLARIAVDLAHPSHEHHSDQLPEIVERALEAVVEAIVFVRWGKT